MKHFSRRRFLQSASLSALSLSLPSQADAWVHGDPTVTGKIVLNLGGVAYFNNVYPFINMWKVGASLEFRTAGGTVIATTANSPNTAGSPWGTYCDFNGAFINPFPNPATGSLVTNVRRIIYNLQSSAPGPQNLIASGGQSMKLSWSGGGGWTAKILNGNVSIASSGTSPLSFTWPTSAAAVNVEFDVGTLADPPTNIQLYQAKFQSRVNAGEIMDPDYIAQVKQGSGIIRFSSGMQSVNSDTTVTSIDQISSQSNFQWGTSEQTGQSGFRECPLAVMASAAVASNKNPWISIPVCFLQQKSFTFTATASNPAHCSTGNPHTYVNGDTVVPYFSNSGGTGFRKSLTPTSFATSTFTLTSHGLVDGYPLQFGTTTGFNNDGQTYPSPIVNLTTYYAKNCTTNTFQISTTPLGTVLTLSGSAPATINVVLQLQGNKYTVANVNQAAGTFDLSGPGSDTTGWSNTGFHFSGTPFDLSWMNTQVQRLVNTFKASLPPNMVPIYEYGNELWNSQFLGYQSVISQINNNIFSNDNLIATGYFMAAAAKGVRDTYGGDHTKYKFIFGGNSTAVDVLASVISGVNLFITNVAPTLAITDLFDYLSVVSYTGGVTYFSDNGPSSTCTFGTNTVTPVSAPTTIDQFNIVPVKFSTTGSLPAGITAGVLGNTPGNPITYPSGSGQIYWAKFISGTNWSISTTPTGSAITFTGPGTGTHTMTRCAADVVQFMMSQGQTFFNQAVSDDIIDGRWTFGGGYSLGTTGNPVSNTVNWAVGRYNYYKTNYLAAAKPLLGLQLIAYEGGESNSPEAAFPLFNDATWRSMYILQQYSQGTADNFLQIKTNGVDAGLLTHQAQFVDFGVFTYNIGFGNFGAQQFVGDDGNLRWKGILNAN